MSIAQLVPPEFPNADVMNPFVKSYHPHIIISRRVIGNEIGSMAEWAVEVIAEIPFLKAFPMKNVQALQLSDFLRAIDLF
jgi:hypothetical protein